MKIPDIMRIFATIVFLVFMWLGHKWALYFAVTMISISIEMIGYMFLKIIKK